MSLPAAFLRDAQQLIPQERRFDDPLSTLAFGTDASFYRLIPKLVIRVESEDEVIALLKLAQRDQVPVTFRAAGTSLSGQAISGSVLIVLGDNWNGREIRGQGTQIRLQPGVIGAQANAWLAPFGRKIGPDPASINACKIGGIVANNASGMCCGTAQNTYHTLAGLRLVLADGTRLDSEDPASVAAFESSHAELLEALARLGRETRANTALAERIRHKYRLKNTTGLSLNALVDYDQPLDILQHLLVGSEGTLGFISAVTYDTVPDHPHKASALLVFPSVESCCRAVTVLKRQPVSAVELLAVPEQITDFVVPGLFQRIDQGRGLAPGFSRNVVGATWYFLCAAAVVPPALDMADALAGDLFLEVVRQDERLAMVLLTDGRAAAGEENTEKNGENAPHAAILAIYRCARTVSRRVESDNVPMCHPAPAGPGGRDAHRNMASCCRPCQAKFIM